MYKALAFGMALLIAAPPAFCEEDDGVDDGDFVELEKGQAAPFDGYLFDHGGIAALVAKHDAEKEQLELKRETDLKKLKIDLDTEIAKKQSEIDINKKLSEDIIKANKEQIEKLNLKIERASWIQPTLFVGGVLTGTALTVAILKIAVQMVK